MAQRNHYKETTMCHFHNKQKPFKKKGHKATIAVDTPRMAGFTVNETRATNK